MACRMLCVKAIQYKKFLKNVRRTVGWTVRYGSECNEKIELISASDDGQWTRQCVVKNINKHVLCDRNYHITFSLPG